MGSGFIQNTESIIRLVAYQFASFLPYVIGGVILGEILKLTSWTKLFYKLTNKSTLFSSFIASILGVVSPICTIGTVPVCIQLFRSGVKLTPLLTFLSASTMMNPQMFLYTWGFIGPKMAILRVITVIIVSLAIGFLSSLIPSKKLVNNKIFVDQELGHEIETKQSIKKISLKDFAIKCWNSFEYIAFYMIIGIFIGVLIDTFIADSYVQSLFSGDKWYSVVFSALIGIPIYQCGAITIPIIKSMIGEGMGYGQALTFFLVGPVTNFTPIMSIATILKPRYVVAYLISIFLLSVAIGYAFDPISNFLYKLITGF